MGTLRRSVKGIIEAATHRKIMRVGSRDFLIAARRDLDKVWYSYDLLLERVLKELDITVVLDIGAYTGEYAETLRDVMRYRGRIISFEPVSPLFERLRARAAGDPKWQVHNIALGSRSGRQAITAFEGSSFSSFLHTNAYCVRRFGEQVANAEEELAVVRRLDDVLDELDVDCAAENVFLKMDTQGYDLEVFKGLGGHRAHVAALQSEVSVIPIYDGMPHWTESLALFESEGFTVAGLFPVSRDSLRVIEYDCLMVRGTARRPAEALAHA